ncbi:MAG: glycoside hydrolase family 2 protein, partial [Gemmatimonadaceae bacterium]|nr:glycoside hydrolase family 2 protein [Gemmatimonadaceae bacterium]
AALDRVADAASRDDAAFPSAAASPRERVLLDAGWRFLLGHAADPGPEFNAGNGNGFNKSGDLYPPSNPKFDASGWAQVDLPHDWAVDLPFVNDPRLASWGFKPVGRAWPETSVGWYRRTFAIPATDAGRRLSIEFDGVFRDATVAVNGHFVGRNLSGYAPFTVDITDFANYGGDNVVVVRVDATEHEGWFYEGAGIYRHVWLVKTSPVHVRQWGTYVTTEHTTTSATVRVATELQNESAAAARCRVASVILDASGKTLATDRSTAVSIPAFGETTARQQLHVPRPSLWTPETPYLYTLVTTVERDGVVIDRYETPFGVRTMRFDAHQGFLLNGKRVELKGTCNHQDHAGVGAALPDRLQYYRVEQLKAIGTNAYRTSHNPPTAALMDACDRLGMMVLDEARMFSSSEEGLSQLERLIRRDRNRPSVIAWSIANEEWVDQGSERGARIATAMKRLANRLDPSRQVTAAMDQGWGKGTGTVIDVMGFNYHHKDVDAWRAAHPDMPAFGSETGSTVSTRGIYTNDKERGYVSAYDVNAQPWSSTAEAWWSAYAVRPWVAGGFVWTGFDYRGEPTPYGWPCVNSHFGILDTCGFPKDEAYSYKAWWSGEPVLHLFPHWNWAGRENQEIDVWCHTNAERVELFLNGTSLGTRDVARNSHAEWKVPYKPGRLEARAVAMGKPLTDVRETSGAPARIDLVPDRATIDANGEDVAVLTVQVVDADGRVVPIAMDEITFHVTGAGRLIGVGNGDPSSHESDRGPTRRAFNGLCSAIVQSSREAGALRVEATAPGLAGATIEVTTRAATSRLGA